MRYLLILITFFLSFTFLFNFENPKNDYQKKINKVLLSVWGNNELITKRVVLPDSLNDPTFKLNSIFLNDSLVGYYCLKDANGCHKGGCDNIDTTIFYTEYEVFVFMVIFNKDLKIERVDVIDYQSNHGFQITSKTWLKQFIGFEGCEMEYGKNVDAITSATTSAKSLVKNINWICESMYVFRKYKVI